MLQRTHAEFPMFQRTHARFPTLQRTRARFRVSSRPCTSFNFAESDVYKLPSNQRIVMQRSVREEREIGGSRGHNQPAQPEHFFSSIFIDKDDYGSKQKFDKLPSKLFGQNVFKLLSLATFCCLFTNIHSEMFEESNLDYLK